MNHIREAILRDYDKSLEINGELYRVKSYSNGIIKLDTDYEKERSIGGTFLMCLLTLHVR